MAKKIRDDYPLNSCVTVRITHQIPSGLLGRLNDGTQAIIRKREVAWNGHPPIDEYIGLSRKALVVGYSSARNQLELSLRLVERDPWQKVPVKYEVGQEVSGRIVGLIERGAFVELEPGVEGFLPMSELPIGRDAQIENWLWIDDWVRVKVIRLKPKRRRLRLSLKAPLIRREAHLQKQLWTLRPQRPVTNVTLAEQIPGDIRVRMLDLGADARRRALAFDLDVLLIEDDSAYAAGLAGFLKLNGCRVTVAEDGMAGLALVEARNKPFDLILLDWNLPGPKGHQVAQLLQEQDCPSRMVMILEPAPLLDHPDIWEGLRQGELDVLAKSDGVRCRSSLIAILRELSTGGSGKSEKPQRSFLESLAPTLGQPEPSPSVAGVPSFAAAGTDLHGVLDQLQSHTQASSVMLLRQSPGGAGIDTEAFCGQRFPVDEAPPDLIHSPLKEVLHEGQEVWATVSARPAAFRRLTDLAPFEAFLGVPVPVAQAARYGLVLLRDQGHFDAMHCAMARLAVYSIAGILQEQRLVQTLQRWQAPYLVGRLLNSAIHEMTNKLGGLDFQVETLEEGIRELEFEPARASDPTFVRQMGESVAQVQVAQRQTLAMRNRYLGLTVHDQPQMVDIVPLARDLNQLLKPEAQHHNVLLELEADDKVPPVGARPSQLRQLFLNLMLNAIQQMVELDWHGRLKMRITHAPAEPLPVQVRFVDEGPGIHRCLWEPVFEFGFTTRQDGAGLGLTISRQIARSLGGELAVEESHVLWGTTMLLALPRGEAHD
ncbi:MAG: S1 RNA-binding domain-containing protein [Anaerolineae bacterium]